MSLVAPPIAGLRGGSNSLLGGSASDDNTGANATARTVRWFTRFVPFADRRATKHDRRDASASRTAYETLGLIDTDNWAEADGAVRLGLRHGLDEKNDTRLKTPLRPFPRFPHREQPRLRVSQPRLLHLVMVQGRTLDVPRSTVVIPGLLLWRP